MGALSETYRLLKSSRCHTFDSMSLSATRNLFLLSLLRLLLPRSGNGDAFCGDIGRTTDRQNARNCQYRHQFWRRTTSIASPSPTSSSATSVTCNRAVTVGPPFCRPPPLSLSSSASLFLSHNLIAGFHTVPLIDRSIGSGTRARATSSRLGKFGLHSRGRKSDVQTGRFALPDGAIGDRFCCARVTTDETAEEDRQRKRNGGTVRCCGHGRLPSTSSDSFGRRRRRRHCHANSSLHKEL